jgi:hypothetical protein
MTKLTLHQVKTFGPKPITGYGAGGEITVTVRFDDCCKNGHNTFSITADVTTLESRARRDIAACGGMDAEVARHFPQLAALIPWSGCSTEGPLHYVENTMYWLGRRGHTRWENERAGRPSRPEDPPNFEHAKKSAIWPDMPEGFVVTGTTVSNADVEAALGARLPVLLGEFHQVIESLEMTW